VFAVLRVKIWSSDEPGGADPRGVLYAVPKTAKSRRWRGLAGAFDPGKRVGRNTTHPAGRQHGNDVPGGGMSLSHPNRERVRFREDVGAGGEDEQLEHAVAAHHWLRSQPIAWNLEDYLTPADEYHPAVRHDHPRREIDIGADQQHLAFPDDAVGLEGTPRRATRTTDGRHVPRCTVLLFLAVQHLDFPQHSR
jgi:hypothetical protein